MLWIKFAFVFCRWSGDHGAIRERGRFGSIRMVWTQNTDVSPGKSGSMMSLTSYWRNGAPVLVVMTSPASSPYLNCVGWQDMCLTETMKCRVSSPCLNCVGWQDISLTEGRASSPCLDCVGWQDMRLVSGQASSPCLNCMGWQDTSLTVVEDRASSPYLNCIGWLDKSSSRWSFPMIGVLPLGLNCRSEEPQCSVNCICTIRMLPNWPRSRTASSWSLGR